MKMRHGGSCANDHSQGEHCFVSEEDIKTAGKFLAVSAMTVSSLQNRYTLRDSSSKGVLDHAAGQAVDLSPGHPHPPEDSPLLSGMLDGTDQRLGAMTPPVSSWTRPHAELLAARQGS